MGAEIPHAYDLFHERFTPRVSEEATEESLTERIAAYDALLDSTRDEEEAKRLAQDRSDLADIRNRMFKGNENSTN